eukprot:TRINITY_DN896_c3_g1_i1.p1 TRINITY_DN896_c3_g1~~TRINITY_DN896_c3_g1_i1.p1  ORF type:complete len:287 (+),score=61.45 TRINITY_DN896_c3_g1_i1:69-929(+)
MSADQQIIRQVRQCRGDYYRMLGVGTDVEEAELTRAYRKLSLKVHPDRNKEPGAEEAFKTVGHAYATLKDPKQRQVYDVHGEEGLKQSASGGGGGAYHQRGPPEDFLDIFELFMGPQFMHPRRQAHQHQHQHQRQQRRRQQQMHNAEAASSQAFLFMIAAAVYLFVMYMPTEGEPPPFVLDRDRAAGYDVRRLTRRQEIPYWVRQGFEKQYVTRRSLQDLEHAVTTAYKSRLQKRCVMERGNKARLKRRASDPLYWAAGKSAELQRQADTYHMPNCEEYNRMFPYN